MYNFISVVFCLGQFGHGPSQLTICRGSMRRVSIVHERKTICVTKSLVNDTYVGYKYVQQVRIAEMVYVELPLRNV
jgi:hypothetical protein